MQKFVWFGGLEVTQSHQQHNHSIDHILVLLDFNKNYASIL